MMARQNKSKNKLSCSGNKADGNGAAGPSSFDSSEWIELEENKSEGEGGERDAAAGAIQDFEEILELVGSQGKFQKRLLYAILCPLVALNPFSGYGTVFLWDIPNHWCHVPGRGSDVGLEEWKNLTIPLKERSEETWSQCLMLDNNGTKTKCQFGWEYDDADYSSTIPSQFNWGCDQEHYATDCYTYYSMGAAIGTVVFGVLADKYGRKPTLFLGCLLDLIFCISSLFLAQYFLIYKSLMLLRGFSSGALYNVPFLLIAEVCGMEYRGWIYMVTATVWVGGNCGLPFVAMVCRGWFLFGWVSTIPGILVFVYYPFIYESPRWLVTVGKEDKAMKVLLEIARQNGTLLSETEGKVKGMVEEFGAHLKKENESGGSEKHAEIWTLFSNWRLACNFSMLSISLSMNYLLYDVLTLNSMEMGGNRFLNYFYLGLIELPGGWVGGYLVDVVGRRWTQVGFFFVCVLCCLLCTVVVPYPGSTLIVLVGVLGVKFAVTVTSLVVALQATELFPTSLRSTGAGLATTVASIAGVFGPYMVYSGTIHPSLPYGILLICSIMGLVAASLLPETFLQPLPETVKEAGEFGKTHGFWSYLPRKKSNETDTAS